MFFSQILTYVAVTCTLWQPTLAIPQIWQDAPKSTDCSQCPSASTSTDESATHLYNLTRRFFENMLVPNNLIELHGLNSTIFAEDITGRVSDSRKFLGRELNTEYVYGAFTGATVNTTRATLLGLPESTKTMRFAANVPDKSAFITEIMEFNIALLNQTIPVQIDVWFRWNENDEVQAYDARFVYFDWLMANGMSLMQKKWKLPSAGDAQSALKSRLVDQICETAQANCVGDLQQYESREECQKVLMQDKRMGAPFEFGVDSVLCRSLHEGMLTLKPEAHCPHVGPSGGDMCVDDLDYGTYVGDVDFFEKNTAGW